MTDFDPDELREYLSISPLTEAQVDSLIALMGTEKLLELAADLMDVWDGGKPHDRAEIVAAWPGLAAALARLSKENRS